MALSCQRSLLFYLASCLVIESSFAALSPVITHKVEMWKSGDQGEIHTYRTPIMVTLPTGDILAFSAPRKFTTSDKSAKFIVQRRSVDGGLNWDATRVIEDDYDVVDGLNLGAVIIDYETNTTFILFGYCMHTVGNCTSRYRPMGVYVKRSPDWGYTWSPAINIGETNKDLWGLRWAPGPGFGIQKRLAPKKGRLIACGHAMAVSNIKQMECLYSDDHGKSWNLNSPLYGMPYKQPKITGDFVPGETQVIELKNGTLLVAIRNLLFFHCRCRMQALSFDGGSTFPVPYVVVKASLPDPAVFASLALADDYLFLSHPSNAKERVNMTLHWSADAGETWPYAMPIYAADAEYSCLTRIDNNNLGILFERDNYSSIFFYKIRLK